MAKKRKSNSAAAGAAGAVEEAHTVAAKSPVVEAVAAAAPAPAAAKPSKSSSSSSSSRSSRKSAASSSSSSSSSSSRHSLSSTGSTLDSAASFNLPSDWVELTHGGEDTTALEGLGVVPDTAYLKTRIPQTDTLRRYIRRAYWSWHIHAVSAMLDPFEIVTLNCVGAAILVGLGTYCVSTAAGLSF